jgi:Glycosyl transferase family 2
MTQSQKSESRPEVNVIIPCYNYGRYLRGCVTSILNGTRLDVKIIILDDCSNDETEEVTRNLSKEFDRIRVVRHDPNRGHISTYNHGLSLVDAEFVHLISADDQLMPFALDRAVSVMRQHPDVGMVYGRAMVGDTPPPSRTHDGARTKYSVVSGSDWIKARFSDGLNPIYSPEVTLRATIAADAGPYDHLLPSTADLEMWLRIAARSNVAVIKNAFQAFYRIHPNNMHKTHSKEGLLAGLRERRNTYSQFITKDGHLVRGSDQLIEAAQRTIALDALSRAARMFDNGEMKSPDLESVLDFARLSDPLSCDSVEWKEIERRAALAQKRQAMVPWIGSLTTRASDWWRWKTRQRAMGCAGIKSLFYGQLP